jgi:predicted methyltransferase
VITRRAIAGISAGLLLASCGLAFGAANLPANATAAAADPHRPQSDTSRDADRKPAETLAYAGIKPGDKILELIPARGYMTRLLSAAVGPSGHVYALNLSTLNDRIKAGTKPVLDDPAYNRNVSYLEQNFADLKSPEPVDVVWTSMNYHDFKNPGMFSADTAAMDKAIFATLKPGGTYIVIDHIAQPGSGTRDTQTLHRIDPDLVKSEVLAAGFTLEGESQLLRNPEPHTGHSDDKSDKFFFKFRKPR